MPLEEFFTRERLLCAGMQKNAVTRLLNDLMHRTMLVTVKDLVVAIEEKIKDEKSGYRSNNLPGVGRKSLKCIQSILASEGVEIQSL